ncbi:lisH domain-containing protein, partial [Haematococcus lacustris]
MSITQEALQLGLYEADNARKRQKMTAEGVDACLERLLMAATQAKLQLSSGKTSPRAVISGVKTQMSTIMAQANTQTKELHSAVSKLSKCVDKLVDGSGSDLGKVLRDVEMDPSTLDQVLVEHLYREGQFEVGDVLAHEAGLRGDRELRQPFREMHSILQQ